MMNLMVVLRNYAKATKIKPVLIKQIIAFIFNFESVFYFQFGLYKYN